MLGLKLPVTMATRGYLKIAKITILRWFLLSKLISKCCNFSMDWDRVKDWLFSVSYTLPYDRPGVILVSYKFKFFLATRGTTAKPPKQKESHHPTGNPLMYRFDRGRRRKSDHFFRNISQTKNTVWGLNMVMFSCLRPQKGGCRKAVKTRLYEVKGYGGIALKWLYLIIWLECNFINLRY
jgi:hypothetical protein